MEEVLPAPPPKYTTRHVIWNENGEGGHLVLLVGYCPGTLSYFLGLFLEAAHAVPGLDPAKAICAKVQRSATIQGYTMLKVPIKGKRRGIPRFKECAWRDLGIESY